MTGEREFVHNSLVARCIAFRYILVIFALQL